MEEKEWEKQKEKIKGDVNALIVKIIKHYLLHKLSSHKHPKEEAGLISTNIVDIRAIKGHLRSVRIELDECDVCHFLKDLMFGPQKIAEFKFTAWGTSKQIIFYKVKDLGRDSAGHD